jgi:hypothetical protein
VSAVEISSTTFSIGYGSATPFFYVDNGGLALFRSNNPFYFGNTTSTQRGFFDRSGLDFGSTQTLSWENSAIAGAGTKDLFLVRDNSNILAQRNGVNAQTFRVYNTYSDGSNYELLSLSYTSNVARIETTQAGTGSSRILLLRGDQLFLRAGSGGNGIGWQVDNSGNFMSSNDNAYDIGSNAATRPRSVYAGTSITPGRGVAVASLPTPSTGMIARVTDANAPVIGTTVAGGGAAYALVNYNGSNWTVIGV